MAVTYRSTWQMVLVLVPLFFLPTTQSVKAGPVGEGLGWVSSPLSVESQFDYTMSVRLRLLFFWIGKDNVGGGFIRHGIARDNPRQELLQVLFGSDPAKAPRAINRWGAGTEADWHKNAASLSSKEDDVVASAFFGFMKASRGKSVSEMQAELKREKEQGEHLFTGILSRVEAGQATSLVVPLESKIDFNLRQYSEAEPLMIEKLNTSDKPLKSLGGAHDCARAGEFLASVSQLLNAEMESLQRGLTLCYVYDAEVNKLAVEQAVAIPNLMVKVSTSSSSTPVDRNYNDLLETEFVSIHQATGKKSYFTIVTGTRGELRGVPVQIRYQPNWWFQVVLNLLPKAVTQPRQTNR